MIFAYILYLLFFLYVIFEKIVHVVKIFYIQLRILSVFIYIF